jgi:hypothetical protein
MSPTLFVLVLAAAAGWILAAATIGLYMGERGRRQDAQRREGVLRVDPPTPSRSSMAAVAEPAAPNPLQKARQQHIDECVRAGFAEADAIEDWDRLVQALQTDGVTGWGPEI